MLLKQRSLEQPESITEYDLSYLPLEDVVDWLNRRGLSGSLTVSSANRTVCFAVVDGHITSVASSLPADRLGLQLIDAGAIDLRTLYSALI